MLVRPQVCVFAPTFFSLMFSAMLMDPCRDERREICIAYRTDSHLFNHRQMHLQSRVFTLTVDELLLDDNGVLNIISEGDITRTAPAAVSSSNSASPSTPATNTGRAPESPLTSSSSSPLLLLFLLLLLLLLLLLRLLLIPPSNASAPTTTAHNPDTPTNINLTTSNHSDVDPAHTCPHYDLTFTSRTGLVSRLRIHRTGLVNQYLENQPTLNQILKPCPTEHNDIFCAPNGTSLT
ncbi:hypothetical protein SprV_0702265900 [Sparganum proliferum]